MKKFIITATLAVLVSTGTLIMAQNRPDEYLGLPGDNLNLYAVMQLFQQSETIEDFEKNLNDENSKINNLDLNGDNYVDYIKVIDYVDGNVHNIVLQVALDRNENQDVAVFTVQRFDNGSVQIQLTGDEALYGKNYIIEPISDDTPNPGYTGRATAVGRTTTVEINACPLVRFIFLPTYVAWHSSWYWNYYPSYWHPWSPFSYHYYYGYHYNWYPRYYEHYRHWDNHRYARWDDFYYRGKRAHSPYIDNRIREGRYRDTYSHPEQRSQGEASFRQTHPNQQIRSAGNPSGNNSGRRSVSTSSRNRQSTGVNPGSRRSTSVTTNKSVTTRSSGNNSGNSRRSVTTVNNRQGANPSSGQNSGTVRRSRTTVSSSSNANPSSGQKASTSRRSRTTVSNSSGANPSSGQKASTSRRSRTTISNSSGANPSSGQKAQTSRATRQSSSTVRSSTRRSSGSSKSETSAKKEAKSQKSESTKTNRRGN